MAVKPSKTKKAIQTHKAKTAPKAIAQKGQKVKSKSARDVLFDIYSEASEKIESGLFRSQDSENVSGFWPNSLVLSMCYGKINSGLYVASGPEQSAKSSAVASIIGQSIAEGTMLHKHYDVERAMRSSYMGKIIEVQSGVSWEALQGKKDAYGKEIQHPRYRWLLEAQLERIFTEMRRFLSSLPDKIYITETKTWRLVFDIGTKEDPVTKEHDELHKKVAAAFPLDNKLSNRTSKYYDIGDDSSFQAFYAIDSIKAMTLKLIEDETRGFNQPGQMAKALSERIPYVKELLRSKHAVLFAINQMYTNPLQKYGSPNYETAGNAIKLHSDSRCIMGPCAVLDNFNRSKKSGICEEDSVLGNGVDEYTFKKVTNIKNKFSTPYIVGYLRIWSTGPQRQPGIDPVFDTAEFLRIIGLATIGTKNKQPVVHFAKSEYLEGYSEESILWSDFKIGILAECGIGDPENASDLRALCRELLESGVAHRLYEDKNVGISDAMNHLEGEDLEDLLEGDSEGGDSEDD